MREPLLCALLSNLRVHIFYTRLNNMATAAAERDVLDPWGDLRLRYDMQQLLQRRTLPVVSVRGR